MANNPITPPGPDWLRSAELPVVPLVGAVVLLPVELLEVVELLPLVDFAVPEELPVELCELLDDFGFV